MHHSNHTDPDIISIFTPSVSTLFGCLHVKRLVDGFSLCFLFELGLSLLGRNELVETDPWLSKNIIS